MSVKREVMKLIQELPETVTIEEIMQELYVKAKMDAELQKHNKGKAGRHKTVIVNHSRFLN